MDPTHRVDQVYASYCSFAASVENYWGGEEAANVCGRMAEEKN